MSDKTFTEDEMLHQTAREVMKYRMGDLEKRLASGDTYTAAGLAELKTRISQVITMIERQGTQEKESRRELKKEIESEFASKIDLERLENKLDKMWLKITISTSAIVGMGVFIGWLLTTANTAKTFIGH